MCTGLILVALLYASVGLSGASGFVAVMALFGLPPETIKPLALLLNVLVSLLVSLRFARAGHFSWPVLRPFLVLGIPAAFAGGYLTLPESIFDPLLGLLLLGASLPLLLRPEVTTAPLRPLLRLPAMLTGGLIGLVSGMTGMGGGVLLAPVLLHFRWARAKTTAAVSAVFILANSLAALWGHSFVTGRMPSQWPWFALAALTGGYLGAHLGSHTFSADTIRRLLGLILVAAGLALIL